MVDMDPMKMAKAKSSVPCSVHFIVGHDDPRTSNSGASHWLRWPGMRENAAFVLGDGWSASPDFGRVKYTRIFAGITLSLTARATGAQ